MSNVINIRKLSAMSELKKILHAEDDPDIREIAKMSLEMVGGFEILQCHDGAEAVDSAESFASDMFLMDVMMPGMDGRESVAKLRENAAFANTPVVFVTAKASTLDVEKLKSDFNADVITKPFDPISLPDQLRSIWKGAAT